MSEARLTKFIQDQQEAVAIARELTDAPTEYGLRVDALNAALGLAHATSEDTPMARVLANARQAEAYLKGK